MTCTYGIKVYMNKKKIGIVQCSISSDKDYNLNHALELASRESVDFLVFPELFTTGYNLKQEFAEDDSGKTVQALSQFAKQTNTNVIGGSIIEKAGKRLYNTSYVFNRKGNLVGKYSKKHLFRPLNEHKFFNSGFNRMNNDNIFLLDDINIGVMICYDLRFSYTLLDMKYNCTKMIFCPMEWPDARTNIRETFTRARAAESYSYVIAANATGYKVDGKLENLINGHSSIAAPTGDCVFLADNEDKLIVEDVDLDVIDRTKEFFQGGK
jgi:predicted amidohydrolase